MTSKKLLTFLAVYLAVFYSLAALGFWAMKLHYQRSFSPAVLETMISSTSLWRDRTDDLCKYYIFGEPVNAGDKFVKLNFYCDKQKKSQNTLTFKAFSDRSFAGVIRESARIMGFDPKIIMRGNSDWQCSYQQKPVEDFNTVIEDKTSIDCYQKNEIH